MNEIQSFGFSPTKINGVVEIDMFFAPDNRGYFVKDYAENIFQENGCPYNVKETFYSFSSKGVIRGIHFQRNMQLSKLVSVVKGHIYDVVVDLRKKSETFGKWQSFKLCDNERKGLYIPSGCGHGFLALEDSIVLYKTDGIFVKEFDDGIVWDDPNIGINWPLDEIKHRIVLSEKDQNLQSFCEFARKYGGLS